MRRLSRYAAAALLLVAGAPAMAWDNHALLTRLSLAGWDKWESAPFEPIEKALKDLTVDGLKLDSRKSLGKLLQIRHHHVDWDSPGPEPEGADSRGLTVLAWSADTPDQGMDQELRLSEDQEWMGGYTGLPSQAFRHMYWPAWNWRQPLVTLHLPHPTQPMGVAHERAQIFFDLALQAKNTGHTFWAYRFLGFALHYMQDLTQPYHCQQAGSIVLLPYGKILRGKEAFLKEATRIVSNFHLAFELHTQFFLGKAAMTSDRSSLYHQLTDAFKVPRATETLKSALENNMELPVKDAAVIIAQVGAVLTPQVVREQLALMEKELKDPDLDLGAGFFQANGAPKLNLESFEKSNSTGVKKKREQLVRMMTEALSNTGVTTRWLFDKWRLSER